MSDGLNWQSGALVALDAALSGKPAFEQDLGGKLRDRLTKAGTRYDVVFPSGTSSLVNESAEHIAWRIALAAALVDVNDIAASVDGGPGDVTVPATFDGEQPPTITITATDPLDARARVRKRATNAALLFHATLPQEALDALDRFPAEPKFHAAQYYLSVSDHAMLAALGVKLNQFHHATNPPTFGEIETELRVAIAEVVEFITVVSS